MVTSFSPLLQPLQLANWELRTPALATSIFHRWLYGNGRNDWATTLVYEAPSPKGVAPERRAERNQQPFAVVVITILVDNLISLSSCHRSWQRASTFQFEPYCFQFLPFVFSLPFMGHGWSGAALLFWSHGLECRRIGERVGIHHSWANLLSVYGV